MQTTENTTRLTLTDLTALETIARSAQGCHKVAYLNEDGAYIEGTARHFVKSADDLGFLRADEDVRDCVLRITTTTGWEMFLPVRDLMAAVKEGRFAITD